MTNIVEMINAHISNPPVSQLPDFDSWNELGESGQEMVASLALKVNDNKLKELRHWASEINPENSNRVVWEELISYQDNHNRGHKHLNSSSPLNED